MPSTKQVMTREIRMVDPLLEEADTVNAFKGTQEGLAPDAGENSALRTSEIRYRRLFESARDGILILNAATLKITDVNPFMTELLGYSRKEFMERVAGERLTSLRRFAAPND